MGSRQRAQVALPALTMGAMAARRRWCALPSRRGWLRRVACVCASSARSWSAPGLPDAEHLSARSADGRPAVEDLRFGACVFGSFWECHPVGDLRAPIGGDAAPDDADLVELGDQMAPDPALAELGGDLGIEPDRHGCPRPDVVVGDDAGVAVEIEVERADQPAAVDEQRVEPSGDPGDVVVEEDGDPVGVLAFEGEQVASNISTMRPSLRSTTSSCLRIGISRATYW